MSPLPHMPSWSTEGQIYLFFRWLLLGVTRDARKDEVQTICAEESLISCNGQKRGRQKERLHDPASF